MEISGKIKKIFDTQTFGSGFRKREIVLTTQEQYPQDLLIEFTQDRIDLLNKHEVGDEVTISLNLRGREWTSPEGVVKYFNSIQGWRIQNSGGGSSSSNAPEQMPQPDLSQYQDLAADESDDLPF